MRTVRSAEALDKTVPSVGLHCRSSTLAVWPEKGVLSTCQLPLPAPPACAVGFHRRILPAQSPVANRPGTSGFQSIA